MNDQFISYFKSPLGWLKITTNEKALISVSFEKDKGISSVDSPQIQHQTAHQLQQYFDGKRKEFDLEIAPSGSEFQNQVWKLVQQISFGNTASYLDIAIKSGSEKNTRAVGLANGKNPIPIIIPCHRIIGSTGKLTGYSGGLERKRWLLLHEQQYSSKQLLF